MRRREFIALLGAFASIGPVGARAQQTARKRVAVLFGGGENDPEYAARLVTLKHELQQRGWNDGVNLQFDVRFGTDAQMAQAIVPEVLLLAPDVIVVNAGNPVIVALQRATGSIPIVFANMTDPVGAGFVSSLARPGGNITGFTPFEYGISVKWLELLKEIDPRVQRVGVLRDPSNPTGIGMLAAMQGVAPSRGTELVPLGISQANDVENVIASFAREKGGGLVVTLNGRPLRTESSSARQHLSTNWLRSIPCVTLQPTAACCHMDRTRLSHSKAWPRTSIASSRARTLPISLFRRRTSLKRWSTSKPRRLWASPFHNQSSRPPT